jgi:hypothetical protein
MPITLVFKVSTITVEEAHPVLWKRQLYGRRLFAIKVNQIPLFTLKFAKQKNMVIKILKAEEHFMTSLTSQPSFSSMGSFSTLVISQMRHR